MSAGTLQGTGTVSGSVSNTGAAITPGIGTVPGKISITGSLTEGSGATLDLLIDGRTTPGSSYSQLVVSGALGLAGTISATIVSGFTPQSGDQYQVLSFASITGDFNTRNGFFLAPGSALVEQTNSTSININYTVTTLQFLTQPVNTNSGEPITPAVQVEVVDSSGHVVTSDSSDTITVSVNQNSFDPFSVVSSTVVNGIATFSNLILDQGMPAIRYRQAPPATVRYPPIHSPSPATPWTSLSSSTNRPTLRWQARSTASRSKWKTAPAIR